MRILSFDVSTKDTGAVIFDQDTNTHIYKQFSATESVAYKRIRTQAKAILEWVKNKQFDILIISKAQHRTINANIAQLEGILLAIAVEKDIKFEYNPDISWYSLIGNTRDERPTKKANSIKNYLKNNVEPDEYLRTEKIYIGNKLEKLIVHLKDGTTITDDIADAWNNAYLYEAKQKRFEIDNKKSNTQKELNKLRKATKANREKVNLLQHQINIYESQAKKFYEEYEIKGNKMKLNSYNKRIDEYIPKLKDEMKKINSQIEKDSTKIDQLMSLKLDLKTKKENMKKESV